MRGSDEFSQFGEVFNQMSSQLEQRIEELDSERRRVQEFGQRFGAALAATHDVASLLEIVVDSAVQLARAEGARLLVADEGTDVLVEQLRRGELGAAAGLLDAPVRYGEGIEGRALQTRQAVIGEEPVPLLAAPLVAEERVLGLLTLVGDPDRPFGRDDAERVGSLVGQGAVAIENARLHRLIQKQAKTDPLTQLLNRREFEEQLARESSARSASARRSASWCSTSTTSSSSTTVSVISRATACSRRPRARSVSARARSTSRRAGAARSSR